jgi:hypothetical protein
MVSLSNHEGAWHHTAFSARPKPVVRQAHHEGFWGRRGRHRHRPLPLANQFSRCTAGRQNLRTPSLDFEQNKNKTRTIAKQEMEMTDLVQDVVSLLSMSTFIVTMAMWIGAM